MRTGYWKQTRWNEYGLFVGGDVQFFKSYVALYDYCLHNGIDARQV